MKGITALFGAVGLAATMAVGTASAQQPSVQAQIEDWLRQSQDSAREMLQKYGQPDVVSSEHLAWENMGPWLRTVVYSYQVDHDFPAPHKDVLEQSIAYNVPPDMMDEITNFDGSIIVWHTRGTMAARCHAERANFIAINVADDVVKRRRSVSEARQQYTDLVQAYMRGDRPVYSARTAVPPAAAGAGAIAG